ncbi:hypothetical protein D3C87_1717030 [compost metagenome]
MIGASEMRARAKAQIELLPVKVASIPTLASMELVAGELESPMRMTFIVMTRPIVSKARSGLQCSNNQPSKRTAGSIAVDVFPPAKRRKITARIAIIDPSRGYEALRR